MNWFSSKENKTIPWVHLTSEEGFKEALTLSETQPIIIFKHSPRCSISTMVLSSFERGWDENNETKLFFLDLIQFRAVSNRIEEELKVKHESPQLIIVDNHEARYHSSHNGIDARTVLKELN